MSMTSLQSTGSNDVKKTVDGAGGGVTPFVTPPTCDLTGCDWPANKGFIERLQSRLCFHRHGDG